MNRFAPVLTRLNEHLTLAGTLIAGVLWFFITRRVSMIEEHDARLLLQLERSA